MAEQLAEPLPPPPFTHEALLYADDEEYLEGTVPFIEDGVRAGEPVLVVVPRSRRELLAAHVAPWRDHGVQLLAMEDLGRNPAWIIPAWADFVAPYVASGQGVRGIGEPIWADRTPEQLVECEHHEALLNVAFAGTPGFNLLCPYSTAELDPAVVDEAHRNHPQLVHRGATAASGRYRPDVPTLPPARLSEVPTEALVMPFDAATLSHVRHATASRAAAAGLPQERVDDLLIAVGEAASNSILHGGGAGRIALWHGAGGMVCEIRDGGRITDPLAGRVRPPLGQVGGRGLWLMHQLCDLVQLRALPDGQLVRLHMSP